MQNELLISKTDYGNPKIRVIPKSIQNVISSILFLNIFIIIFSGLELAFECNRFFNGFFDKSDYYKTILFVGFMVLPILFHIKLKNALRKDSIILMKDSFEIIIKILEFGLFIFIIYYGPSFFNYIKSFNF
jgi:hypothetical protein